MSRYEFFRRRIAPLLFLVVVGLIAYDFSDREERIGATIEIELGGTATEVREIAVEVIAGEEVVGRFRRKATGGKMGPCSFEVVVPVEVVELQIEVQLGDRIHVIERSVSLMDGAVVTVPIGQALQREAAGGPASRPEPYRASDRMAR